MSVVLLEQGRAYCPACRVTRAYVREVGAVLVCPVCDGPTREWTGDD